MNPILSAMIEGAVPGLVTASALYLLLAWLRPDSIWRFVPMLAATALTLRYAAWRIVETVPPIAQTENFIAGTLFLVIELAAITGTLLSLLTLTRSRNRSGEVDANRAWLSGRPVLPLVDIFICTYNEDREILERTIVGSLNMDYPNYRLWVLDDGSRPWLKDLCASLGCRYLARRDRAHAKAGNINHALAYVRALPDPPQFIAILDADFVPMRGFLSRAMTLFREGDVGVVQTPQHFINPDPIQANLHISREWPDEQRYFFDIVMPSRDAWGTAFCCGTSSVIRMAALEESGGFPTDSVTEDYLLTLRLKQLGYRTVYLNERLSFGLAPEGLKEYITQRSRWCLGLVQIIRSKDGPFNPANGLGVLDRLGLIESFLYWTATYAFRVASLLVPVLYFLLGVRAVDVGLADGLAHFLPYFIAHLMIMGWVSGQRVLPILNDMSQILAAREILTAVGVGLFKPHGHKFKVTAKGGDRSKRLIQWRLMAMFASILALTLASLFYCFIIGANRPLEESGIVALIWSWYNMAVLVIAMTCCVERPRIRRNERLQVRRRLDLEIGDTDRAFTSLDLSLSGARFRGDPGAASGSEVVLKLGDTRIPGHIVRQGGGEFAIEIEPGLGPRMAMIRYLYSGSIPDMLADIRSDLVARGILKRLIN